MAEPISTRAASAPSKAATADPAAQTGVTDATAEIPCPSCSTANPAEAAFCVECAQPLGRACPACGHGVGNSDFCEACGEWLFPGQCRFCYASLSEGAAFCEECGCDQGGLFCTRCNTRSFFDFCGGCGTPLSEAAEGLLSQQQADPLIQRLRDELQAAAQDAHALSLPPPAAEPVAAPARRRLISSGAIQALRELSAAVDRSDAQQKSQAEALEQQRRADAAAARQRAEEEAQQQLEQSQRKTSFESYSADKLSLSARLRASRERVKAMAAETADKKFHDGQEARRYFMGFRQLMVAEGRTPRAWLCNFAHVEHITPNDCGGPQEGGIWVFDDTDQ